MLVKDVILVLFYKRIYSPWVLGKLWQSPRGSLLILHCFSEGKIKFFIYCSCMCLLMNIQNWELYLTVISVSSVMRLMACRTKICLQFCVYFYVNIWYVTCTILIKPWLSLHLIWGFNFMLQNALKIFQWKALWKDIDLYVNLYLEIHIFVILIFIKTSICLHD